MPKTILRTVFVIVFIIAALGVFGVGCGDDDDDENDDDSTPVDDDDDNDATPVDDDDDDDNDDNDDDDDDDNDDDTTPVADPYDGLAPFGKYLGNMMGISSHMSRGTAYSWKRDFEIQRLVEVGMDVMRNDFGWNDVEPADDQWNLDGYETMVDLCVAEGMEIDAIFHRTPAWAGATDDEIIPAEFADYVGHVATELGDRIEFYEIWNEQNATRFWKPAPNPDYFGTIVKTGYEAIHAVDDSATVIFGGLSDFDENLFDPRGVFNFLARVGEFHPDICDYFDAMAIHPYSFIQQGSPEFGVDWGIYRFPGTVGMIRDVREILTDLGCGDKPIHLTEFGWPSLVIGDQRQANYAVRGLLWSLVSQVDYFYWYTFWDGALRVTPPDGSPEPGDYRLPTEDFFGWFTYPGTTEETEAKPAFGALLGVMAVVGDARYAGDLGLALGWEEGSYAQLLATDTGIWTVALWHDEYHPGTEVPATVSLPDDATGEWTLFDQDGNATATGDVGDGPVDLILQGAVQYLQFARAD
jgi:Cellulase (glycosyl hydrolase family 5)